MCGIPLREIKQIDGCYSIMYDNTQDSSGN